jgi:hypothetical protein
MFSYGNSLSDGLFSIAETALFPAPANALAQTSLPSLFNH